MDWVETPPYVPEEGSPSIYYWYYDIKQDAVWPAEVYHNCWKLYCTGGLWWPEPIKKAPKKPRLENTKGKVNKNADE